MKGQPRRLGADATSQLVLGGYGPAGVIFLALALLVVLVPSKAPESRQTIATTRPAMRTDTAGDAASGTATPVEAAQAPSTAGLKNAKVTLASTCAGGNRQTREPYSPPCITFSGNNGGATSPGVTGDKITVTFREGDLPSVYAVAGQVAEKANIKDTQDDIRRTIRAYFDYFNKNFQL